MTISVSRKARRAQAQSGRILGPLLALLLVGAILYGTMVFGRAHLALTPAKEMTTEKTLPAQGVAQVKAHVKVGSIRIATDAHDSVQVKAVRRIEGYTAAETDRILAAAKVTIERQGDSVVVEDIFPDHVVPNDHVQHTGKRSIELNLEIHLPERRSVDASIDVGDVKIGGQVQNLAVKSSVGNIDIAGVECTGERADVQDDVGSVLLGLRSLPQRTVHVKVGTGDATLRIPAQAQAHVQMSSGVGDVTSAFPLRSAPRGIGAVGSRASGDLNGGGAAIDVTVGVGNVQLKRTE